MSFESLTDERIQSLLNKPKHVTNPKAREVSDANHFKRDYNVKSDDGAEDFVLFLRQNKTVTEDFSCGLRWIPSGSVELILVRYNGRAIRIRIGLRAMNSNSFLTSIGPRSVICRRI